MSAACIGTIGRADFDAAHRSAIATARLSPALEWIVIISRDLVIGPSSIVPYCICGSRSREATQQQTPWRSNWSQIQSAAPLSSRPADIYTSRSVFDEFGT